MMPAPATKTAAGAAPQGIVVRDIAANLREPKLRRFYEYWTAKRGGRRLPARRDLDPLDFPYVLGNLMLIDVLRDPQRFRVRLHGTNVVARMHYDMTGKCLDEVPHPEWRAYILERCRGLASSAEPLLLTNDMFLDGWGSRYQALWLPLGDDGETVDLLVCALIYGELDTVTA